MGEEYQYMVMSRCEGDLKFYINTLSGYCGNCREDNLFFGSIKEHIEGSIKHYDSLPQVPKWLTKKKLHRICSRAMSLHNKKKEALENETKKMS